ncbi:hypothetical protein Ahy_A07g032011 isoform B [Arachis hypogaea]|uniref:UDP-glycosyltransferases domain-containing protein n=1 Tax=Arachis hypogaea TaxID=3818 RepID=A0A445C5R2_ARAHY|nr:hypothetical protein Ahy_A07g032011 isoform B [Arachis hypogaea]
MEKQRKGVRLVLLPLPFQGHINPMLQLANILYSKGFSITIIHTTFNPPNPLNYPHFTFCPIQDGITDSSSLDLLHLIILLNIRCVTPFRDMLAKVISDARDNKEIVACLISDALFYFTQAVSNTFELPRIVLRTSGASSFVSFVLFPLLIERGYIPIQDSQLEETVTEIPPLKVKDLPLIDTKEPEKYYKELSNLVEAITAAKFLEIAWGLASSMHPFLWVIRKGMVIDDGKECLDPPFPAGFIDNLEGRGYIVKWAPQQEVLAHKAVGAFWTHCGWNSTLESICEGVPMICMPFFTDQKVNARYVSSVWKIGVQFEGEVKREEVVKMIRGLIEGNNKEGSQIRERVLDLKEKARVSWNHGGSSYTYLDALVNFILSFEPKR